MATTLVIHSFGNIDFWNYTLGAVKNILGDSNFQALAAGFLVIGTLLKILRTSQTPTGAHLIGLFSVPIILTGLLRGSVDVIIRDEILNQDNAIKNVPIIVAIPAWFVTTVSNGLGELFDTYFSLPDGVNYFSFGYDIGAPTFKNSFNFGILNAYYDRSWTNFMKDCVIPSISQGRIDANALINSSDISTELSQVNPAYTTEYCDLSGNCETLYCDEAWNKIQQDTITLLNTAQDRYVYKVLTEKNIYSFITKQRFIDDFGNISDYFLNYSVALSDYLKQTVLIKEFYKGLQNSANYYSSTDNLIARYMAEASKVSTNQMLIALGELAGSYIPLIKKILLIIFIGATPLIFLLLYIEDLRSKAITSYLTVLLSLTFWEPLFAILNLIISLSQQHQYSACSTGTDTLSMVFFSCLVSSANTMSAIAGAAAWAVPTIALGLASGSAYAIVSGISSITGRISGGINASIATPQGASSVGKEYASIEESNRLGTSYADIMKVETQSYTEAQAAKLLASDNYFFEKGAFDITKSTAQMDAYRDLDLAYKATKFETLKAIGQYEGEAIKYDGQAQAAGKTSVATSTNLVYTAEKEPNRFDQLVSGTRAIDVIDKALKDLPMNWTQIASRATQMAAKLEGRLSLNTLAQLVGGKYGELLKNGLEKLNKTGVNLSPELNKLVKAAISGRYSIDGKSQEQVAADLKRLMGLALYGEISSQGGIDQHGLFNEKGAELLREFLTGQLDKAEQIAQDTHPHQAFTEFKKEAGETFDAVKDGLTTTLGALGLASYAAHKAASAITNPSTSDNKPKRRVRKPTTPKPEPQKAPKIEPNTPSPSKEAKVETKSAEPVKETSPLPREEPNRVGKLATVAETAESISEALISRPLQTTALGVMLTPSVLSNGELPHNWQVEKILGSPEKDKFILQLRADNGMEGYLPVVKDDNNLYNALVLEKMNIGYNPESGNFYDTQTYKIVSPPDEALVGQIKDGKITLNEKAIINTPNPHEASKAFWNLQHR